MIIARPVGGLANQMSVYAAAKALTVHLNVDLKLDLAGLANDTKRIYELDKLNVNAQIASQEEITDLIGSESGLGNWVRKKLRRKGFRFGVYKERSLQFDEGYFQLPNDLYISGNFHSVRYYEPIRELLREEFKISLPLSSESAAWQRKIASTSSVAVHIRRGDYASDPKTRSHHGLLNLDYYRKAIKVIAERVETPELYIFSDDHAWVQDNLKTDCITHYVDCNNSENGYQDFHLMCQCQHNIIANSGFSRWPAWLNNTAGKVVCMPEQWLIKKSPRNEDNAPLDWIRVPNQFV